MMGKVIRLRFKAPVIYIDGSGDHYSVNVRPCPLGIPSLVSFKSYTSALNYAVDLQNEHDWAIDIAHGCRGTA